MSRGLADTSLFIAGATGRRIDAGALPDILAISVVTIGELRAGVLAAAEVATRDRRLGTLTAALQFDPVPIDAAVAEAWARLRLDLRDARRAMPINDSWIAATALSLGVAVVTQDDDYVEVGDLEVIRV